MGHAEYEGKPMEKQGKTQGNWDLYKQNTKEHVIFHGH